MVLKVHLMEDYLMSTEQIELCVSWRDKEVFKNHTPHSIHASFAKETDNGLDKWGIPPIGSQLSFDVIPGSEIHKAISQYSADDPPHLHRFLCNCTN